MNECKCKSAKYFVSVEKIWDEKANNSEYHVSMGLIMPAISR